MAGNNISNLSWPGNSPDINPIENLWAIVKKRLRSHYCTMKTKLIQAIIAIWNRDIEVKDVSETSFSMSDRVAMLIKAERGYIKY